MGLPPLDVKGEDVDCNWCYPAIGATLHVRKQWDVLQLVTRQSLETEE